MTAAMLAQVRIHDYTKPTCESSNGFCPSWIADNFDRYVGPFFEHVYLTVVSVGAGFAIAFAMALVAHRRRWLGRRSPGSAPSSTRSPASPPSSSSSRSPVAAT